MSSKQIYDLSGKFQEAFDFFNEQLFRNRLPQVIITTQRHRGAYGFFCPKSYIQRSFDEDGDMLVPEYQVHEISIMPDNMYGRPDREVLSTLVHEMCHLQQQEQGKPSRNGYHNKQWGDYMRTVGLEPSSYGKNDSRNPELRKLWGADLQEKVERAQQTLNILDPQETIDREKLRNNVQVIQLLSSFSDKVLGDTLPKGTDAGPVSDIEDRLAVLMSSPAFANEMALDHDKIMTEYKMLMQKRSALRRR